MNPKVLAAVVLGLAVVALSLGAAALGPDAEGRVERAEALLRGLYERGDPEAVVDRLAEGSFGADEETGSQLGPALGAVLSEQLEVTDSRVVEVRGVPLVEVSTPRLQWCVTPESELILGCRVATAELDAAATGAPLEVQFAAVDVFADRVDLTLVLTTTGQEAVTLGDVSIASSSAGAPLELADVSFVAGGQRAPAPPGDVAVQPGVGTLLLFQARDAEDVEATLEGPFTVGFDGGEVEVAVPSLDWVVGGDPAS